MDRYFVDHTEDTPRVELNADESIFEIKGKSLPENAVAFYAPVINWIVNYGKSSPSPITFDFNLEYFNTASAKQITKIFLALQDLSENVSVKVRWYYLSDDADIQASGARFARLIKVNIELIPFEDN